MEELTVNGVADVTLEGSQRLFLGFALGELAVEVGSPCRVGLADLAEGGEMKGGEMKGGEMKGGEMKKDEKKK